MAGFTGRVLIQGAGIFVLGMITGAAFAHNFALAGKPDNVADGLVGGISPTGMVAVILGLVVCLTIGFSMRETRESEA